MKHHIYSFVLSVLFLAGVHNHSCFSQDVIKILAIGNSFSQDAVEEYLDDLARAADIDILIGNACIGGCHLEKHWYNALHDSTNYSYRKINTEGERIVTPNVPLLHCILDEEWDYITFQQASGLSGIPDTYFPYLSNLMEYVKNNALNKNVKLALHQTWAYAHTSTHARFADYNKDQEYMYACIVKSINRAAENTGVHIIIPAGTTIQNARISLEKDEFCRDGYHLNNGLGRYAAACAWFETLLGNSVVGNNFFPETITREEAHIIQLSAQYAVKTPDTVTPVKQTKPVE